MAQAPRPHPYNPSPTTKALRPHPHNPSPTAQLPRPHRPSGAPVLRCEGLEDAQLAAVQRHPLGVQVKDARQPAAVAALALTGEARVVAVPTWSKAVESAALHATSLSARGLPSGWALPWECRATQSRQVRPEEAPEPSWATAKGSL
jgi:hypothetical protein